MVLLHGPRRPWAKAALAATLAALTGSLQGCGGSGGSGPSPPPSPSPPSPASEHEVACSDQQARGGCTKCLGYKDGEGSCQACRAPLQLAGSACTCPPPAARPPRPDAAADLNGEEWPEACYQGKDEYHFFLIGDWGGYCAFPPHNECGPGQVPKPFDNTYDDAAHRRTRTFVTGVDDKAQQLVRDQMVKVARTSRPEFVLNVGDNFYPGGIDEHCDGNATTQTNASAYQFHLIFESMYNSTELQGKEWMGVLGNHDYGGVCFNKGWPQQIYYTWSRDDSRWIMPAQYFKRKVHFPNFSVDLFFLDSNVVDSTATEGHNICSVKGNTMPGWYCTGYLGFEGQCGATDFTSPATCVHTFASLWHDQVKWLEDGLNRSTADWQIVVTHFPPNYDPLKLDLMRLSEQYGIDLIATGHAHYQAVFYEKSWGGFDVGPTAWVISGGGGGITSESPPNPSGHDDQYGFMDMTISKDLLVIKAYSHGDDEGGNPIIINTTALPPRPRATAVVPLAGQADDANDDDLLWA